MALDRRASLPLRYLTGALSLCLSACGGGTTTVATPSAAPALSILAGAAATPVGHLDGAAASAQFNGAQGLVSDSGGNVWVLDDATVVRRISAQGQVTTPLGSAGVYGSSDGLGTAASFNAPRAIAIDQAGNLYVSDTGNQTIRKISPSLQVTTLAGTAGSLGSSDGSGSAASFDGPWGIAVDSGGNVYVSDSLNHTVRKITPAGVVTTLAGSAGVAGYSDGTGALARFDGPQGLCIDTAGNLYVADTFNQVVRKVSPAGVVTTLAGTAGVTGSVDGVAATALFDQPTDIAVDTSGNVWVYDAADQHLRRIHAGQVTTVLAAGSPTQGVAWTQLAAVQGLAMLAPGQLLLSEDAGVAVLSGWTP